MWFIPQNSDSNFHKLQATCSELSTHQICINLLIHGPSTLTCLLSFIKIITISETANYLNVQILKPLDTWHQLWENQLWVKVPNQIKVSPPLKLFKCKYSFNLNYSYTSFWLIFISLITIVIYNLR